MDISASDFCSRNSQEQCNAPTFWPTRPLGPSGRLVPVAICDSRLDILSLDLALLGPQRALSGPSA